VLLSPHSQALGPGHAAAERHLGGFPLRRGFLYQGFLLLCTGAAGIHQQLSPDWRGSTPSSSFSSPPTSLLKTTHTHTALHVHLPPLDALYSLLCLSASFSFCRSFPLFLTGWAKQADAVFTLLFDSQHRCKSCTFSCDRQIVTFAHYVFW